MVPTPDVMVSYGVILMGMCITLLISTCDNLIWVCCICGLLSCCSLHYMELEYLLKKFLFYFDCSLVW